MKTLRIRLISVFLALIAPGQGRAVCTSCLESATAKQMTYQSYPSLSTLLSGTQDQWRIYGATPTQAADIRKHCREELQQGYVSCASDAYAYQYCYTTDPAFPISLCPGAYALGEAGGGDILVSPKEAGWPTKNGLAVAGYFVTNKPLPIYGYFLGASIPEQSRNRELAKKFSGESNCAEVTQGQCPPESTGYVMCSGVGPKVCYTNAAGSRDMAYAQCPQSAAEVLRTAGVCPHTSTGYITCPGEVEKYCYEGNASHQAALQACAAPQDTPILLRTSITTSTPISTCSTPQTYCLETPDHTADIDLVNRVDRNHPDIASLIGTQFPNQWRLYGSNPSLFADIRDQCAHFGYANYVACKAFPQYQYCFQGDPGYGMTLCEGEYTLKYNGAMILATTQGAGWTSKLGSGIAGYFVGGDLNYAYLADADPAIQQANRLLAKHYSGGEENRTEVVQETCPADTLGYVLCDHFKWRYCFTGAAGSKEMAQRQCGVVKSATITKYTDTCPADSIGYVTCPGEEAKYCYDAASHEAALKACAAPEDHAMTTATPTTAVPSTSTTAVPSTSTTAVPPSTTTAAPGPSIFNVTRPSKSYKIPHKEDYWVQYTPYGSYSGSRHCLPGYLLSMQDIGKPDARRLRFPFPQTASAEIGTTMEKGCWALYSDVLKTLEQAKSAGTISAAIQPQNEGAPFRPTLIHSQKPELVIYETLQNPANYQSDVCYDGWVVCQDKKYPFSQLAAIDPQKADKKCWAQPTDIAKAVAACKGGEIQQILQPQGPNIEELPQPIKVHPDDPNKVIYRTGRAKYPDYQDFLTCSDGVVECLGTYGNTKISFPQISSYKMKNPNAKPRDGKPYNPDSRPKARGCWADKKDVEKAISACHRDWVSGVRGQYKITQPQTGY